MQKQVGILILALADYAAMPSCSLTLEGVAEEWAIMPSLISRLNREHRLIRPCAPGGDLNTTIPDVAHNEHVIRPLLERMANEASWELFCMNEIKTQLLGTRQAVPTSSYCT